MSNSACVSFIEGPLVGGILADRLGRRAAFLVNLPIGAAALAVVATFLPGSIGRSARRGAPTDNLLPLGPVA